MVFWQFVFTLTVHNMDTVFECFKCDRYVKIALKVWHFKKVCMLRNWKYYYDKKNCPCHPRFSSISIKTENKQLINMQVVAIPEPCRNLQVVFYFSTFFSLIGLMKAFRYEYTLSVIILLSSLMDFTINMAGNRHLPDKNNF